MNTVYVVQPKVSQLSSTVESDSLFKEWEKARGMLEFFDDKLHDLRKYGFGFVTALLTANGFLVSSKVAEDMADISKFGVFSVTLILILALQLFDKNYRVFQQAASTRALLLERKLNMELTETIIDRFRIARVDIVIYVLYGLLILGVLVLGCFSLGTNYIYITILALIAIITTLLTFYLKLGYRYEQYAEDWMISPLECKLGGTVQITLNNIGKPVSEKRAKELLGIKFQKGADIPEPIQFEENGLIWEIINEKTGKVVCEEKAQEYLEVSQSLTWTVEFHEAGIFLLHPRDWPMPLHRRITVLNDK